MNLYITKTPRIVKFIFKDLIWDIKTDKKEVFLTFDDGPTPEVTHFVLDTLKQYNAKATFFCIGKNVVKHPTIFEAILNEGHTIGNHTHNHFNCKKHSLKTYLYNIFLTEDTFEKQNFKNPSKLFRPPYGRISRNASKILLKKGYTIIMWDVLSADFNTRISVEKCIKNVLTNAVPGSIIVFHDSKKAYPVLKEALPIILKQLNAKGYSFNCIQK